MHARTHKFLHSHLKCCWDIVVFAAKTLHGTPNLICVCRHSNTFPELKASREFSNWFFKAGTMLVCDWLIFQSYPSFFSVTTTIDHGFIWLRLSEFVKLSRNTAPKGVPIIFDLWSLGKKRWLGLITPQSKGHLWQSSAPGTRECEYLLNWWCEKRINLCPQMRLLCF